jgi:hypothetical protein
MRRLLTVKEVIKDYLDGKVDSIPELDEKLLDFRSSKDEVVRMNDWIRISSIASNQCP